MSAAEPDPKDPKSPISPPDNRSLFERVVRRMLGRARSLQDPGVFHRVSLIALLAWVGLGADGLSSSSYGPEAMFNALGTHTYMAVMLAVASAFTVFVISWSYSKIIEHFPFGGGGYVVATKLLGPAAGVVSGSALLIDYVLTITTSIAAGGDAIFSLYPEWVGWKLTVEFAVIGLLVVMNLRGVKESVTILAPVFVLFLVTHAVLIVGTIGTRASEFPEIIAEVHTGFTAGASTLGLMGMMALFLRAYSSGAGTYTGIEAVSNGLMIMREPKVETGKRTMVLMAVSLALTASGITLGYLLVHASPEAGKTMNAVLADRFAGNWMLGGVAIGKGYVTLTLIAEALLLFVAAQAGFIDGPRVMANMAIDSWLPHRFSQLSDRLTMQNGVLLMGITSLVALAYTRGAVGLLVDMYAINVFVTFSLSQAAMCRYWWRDRKEHADWKKNISIHLMGLSLCLLILVVNVVEKFLLGGWVTILVTSCLIGLCFWIRGHYRTVRTNLNHLDSVLDAMPTKQEEPIAQLQPTKPTAVLMVGGYSGLGVHSLLSIQRLFPGHFKNFVFLSVGVVDSATFINQKEVEEVRARTAGALNHYVDLAHRLGLAADSRMSVGTEAVAEVKKLCIEVGTEFPRALFFAGKLVFQKEYWFQRLLHNESAYQIQRQLQFAGLNAMVLPVRVIEPSVG